MTHTIKCISPIDGRYQQKTTPLAELFSEYGLIYYRVFVEIKWLLFLAKTPDITHVPTLSPEKITAILQLIENFSEQDAIAIKNKEKETNHDVKAVEYWLKEQLRKLSGLNHYIEAVHFACTSEDINNISYALMLRDGTQKVLLPHLSQISDFIKSKAQAYAHCPMLSRTHGQTASPTTMGKEWANVHHRLTQQSKQLMTFKPCAKINGAVGNFNAHLIAYPNANWPQLAEQFITDLNLEYLSHTTQIEPHDKIAELSHIICRINTILIDFCRDIWGYISLNYFSQKTKVGEVGSSTMPHKVNPIDFENAEGNLGLANALFNHFAEKLPISRWQRDLTDSTVLRNLGSAFAYTLIAFASLTKGLDKLQINDSYLQTSLESQPEVLAEAIQTVMRCHNIDKPYEKLKNLTRGQALTLAQLREFIQSQPLPQAVKANLLKLTPSTYIGLAATLAKT